MNRRGLSLIAAVNKKRSTAPVFLIYAGIIHAIGLALLMPMLVTLPGPGEDSAPEATAIDVEIIHASQPLAKIEQTSALPSVDPAAAQDAPADRASEPAALGSEVHPDAAGPDAAAKPGTDAPDAVANISPQAQPEPELEPEDGKAAEQEEPAGKAKAHSNAETAKPAKAAPASVKPTTVKKPVVQRAKSSRPAAHRTARAKSKPIAPFNGALSGLFTPGAPAKRR